jgi:hypothetical protein
MDAYDAYEKFPDAAKNFPDVSNIFPDILLREFLEKPLRHSGLLLRNRLLEPGNRKIPCKIPCYQGICMETGAISTASPARQSGVRSGHMGYGLHRRHR